MADFITHFSTIPDPRIERTKKYPLIEILFLCMCAVVSGASGWEEIEDFGLARLSWLRKFLPYQNGIAGHDTIARVMSRLDPKALQTSFVRWMQDVVTLTKGAVIALDGKTLRQSFRDGDRKNAIHIVNAWSSANKVTFGQVKVDKKTNEIKAIPELLEILAVKGAIITIDAMGCQTAIAEKIIKKEADYVLALKGNQSELNQGVRNLFAVIPEALESDYYEDITKDHGRIETRICRQLSVSPEWLPEGNRWPGLKSIIEIRGIRAVINGETTDETRYFISSLDVNAKRACQAVRDHWGVENSLHWTLDMAYREDECRIRRENGAELFAVLRRLSLNLIKNDTSRKGGVNRKRKMAAMDPEYHMQLICQFQGK